MPQPVDEKDVNRNPSRTKSKSKQFDVPTRALVPRLPIRPGIFSSWLDITSGALSALSAASDDSISVRSSGFGMPEHKHSVQNNIMGYGTLP